VLRERGIVHRRRRRLITFNDEWVPDHTAEELREKGYGRPSRARGDAGEDVLIFTNGGLDRSTAVCSVEPVDGKPVFADGPYVETKEHLGGIAVVDVPDDEAARYWAGRLATVLDWPQEVGRWIGTRRACFAPARDQSRGGRDGERPDRSGRLAAIQGQQDRACAARAGGRRHQGVV
jgi:hypothetical protein